MSEQETLATNTATGAEQTQEQAASQPRTYTEEEFNNHMAGLKASLTKKLLKPYEDLGDIEELRSLREQAQKKAQEESLKKGEFEKILQDLAAKKDQEISKRDSVIKEYKIDSPLLNAAAGKPIQVEDLVKEWLDANPHFVSANPATSSAKSSVTAGAVSVTDISKLDMKNPEHRKVYAEYRKANGIA
jgi:hypothetical protein